MAVTLHSAGARADRRRRPSGPEARRGAHRRGPCRARRQPRGGARSRDILAVGAEPWRGDPDRVGTLRYALDNVTLLLWLLGTATGDRGAGRRAARIAAGDDARADRGHHGARGRLRGRRHAAGRRVRLGVREMQRANERNEVPVRAARGRPGRRRRVARCGARRDRVAARSRAVRVPAAWTDHAKDVLVDTDWVADHLDDPSIRIVEVDENPRALRRGPHPRRDRLRLAGRPAGPGAAQLPRARGLRRAPRARGASPTTTRSCSTAIATTGSPPTRTGT